MKKGFIILLCSLLLVVSLATGCGGGGATGGGAAVTTAAATTAAAEAQATTAAATTAAATAGKTEANLTIWVYGWEKASADKVAEDAVSYLEDTGTKVEVVPVASDNYSTKIQATLAGGENPDLAFIDAGYMSIQLASRDKIIELDDYGVNDYKDRFYESVWDTMTYNGKVHGLRITANNLALFYNKDMFDKIGLDYPTEAWTWDDLREAAIKLTDHAQNIYGLDLPIYNADGGYTWTWLPFLWQNNGVLLNDDRTEAIFNSPEGVEALEFWKTMVQTDESVPLQAPPSGIDRFSSEMIAMSINGPWMLNPYVNDPDFGSKFDVAPLPQRKVRSTVVGGEGIVIFSNTKYPAEAYNYLVHLTCSEFTEVFWENWITIPPQPAYVDFYKDLAGFGPYIQVFSDQMSVSQTRQFTPSWPQITNAIGLGLQDYMFDRTDDAQAALDQTVLDVNKILKEDNN